MSTVKVTASTTTIRKVTVPVPVPVATHQVDAAPVRVDVPAPSPKPIQTQARTIASVAVGPQGPKGEPGASGTGALSPINFAFGDATPAPVLVLPAPGPVEVTGVSLQIEEAFDGEGAQVCLGTADAPELLMPGWANAPGQVGVYELTPRVELPGGATLILTLTPGVGATRGRGQFVVTVAIPTA